MRKGLAALLVLLCLGLGAAFVGIWLVSDREGPEIAFGTEEFTYTEDMQTGELLEGVTATDARDGDVTDSLTVDTVFVDADSDTAAIVYVAKDSRNNVTKAQRNVPYHGDATGGKIIGPADDDADAKKETSGDEKEDEAEASDESGDAPAESPEPAPASEESADAEEAALAAANEEKIAALAEGAPKFYLSQYRVEVGVGEEFSALSYVQDITDDTDERDTLFHGIQVVGTVDTATPGTYELNYYVFDSAGNQSNVATMQVVVQ